MLFDDFPIWPSLCIVWLHFPLIFAIHCYNRTRAMRRNDVLNLLYRRLGIATGGELSHMHMHMHTHTDTERSHDGLTTFVPEHTHTTHALAETKSLKRSHLVSVSIADLNFTQLDRLQLLIHSSQLSITFLDQHVEVVIISELTIV